MSGWFRFPCLLVYICPPSNFALRVTTPAPIQIITKIIANTVSAWFVEAMLSVLDREDIYERGRSVWCLITMRGLDRAREGPIDPLVMIDSVRREGILGWWVDKSCLQLRSSLPLSSRFLGSITYFSLKAIILASRI